MPSLGLVKSSSEERGSVPAPLQLLPLNLSEPYSSVELAALTLFISALIDSGFSLALSWNCSC